MDCRTLSEFIMVAHLIGVEGREDMEEISVEPMFMKIIQASQKLFEALTTNKQKQQRYTSGDVKNGT